MKAKNIIMNIHDRFNFDNISKEAKALIGNCPKSSINDWWCIKIDYDKSIDKPFISHDVYEVRISKHYPSRPSQKNEKGYCWQVQYFKEVTTLKKKVILPCKVDWCECCDGSGTRSRYDVEGYNINEMMYDEDGIIDEVFAEDYFNGKTDIVCDECEGRRIQTIMDFESCNEFQKEIVKEQRRVEYKEQQDKEDDARLYQAEMGYC